MSLGVHLRLFYITLFSCVGCLLLSNEDGKVIIVHWDV
jgi:hypothetical protein